VANQLAEERIARGQCPECGKEAAPFRLCFDCRQIQRIRRSAKRLAKDGQITITKRGKHLLYHSIQGVNKPVDERWATSWNPPEDDLRFRPKLRGTRVDVDRTLIEVMKHIGRPCTIEEIMAGWGKLRAKRSAPLAADLARIVAAEDKRKSRNAKRLQHEGH